nr:ATPase, F1/V1/A1 complex, alpha/beta subunit, zinc knuckle CX2CX4HX4C [Tanacetum cinerariifolium]
MRDPEPKISDSTLPLKGSSEFIKPRRSSRSSILKASITSGVKSTKMVSFKAGKGSDSLKKMEEDVNDGYEHKKEEIDGDSESNAFSKSQSGESRSCGESISELQVDLEKELVREIVNETVKVNNLSGVVKDSSVGNVIGESNLGPIPVLVSENPILNPNKNNGNSPRTSPNGSPKILRREEILTDEESRSNAMFSFYKVKKWPSLNENKNVNDMDTSEEKLGEMRIANEDSVMQEDDSAKKTEKGMQFLLENGSWLMDGKLFFIQKWEARMYMQKPEPSKVPLWVRIMNIPLEAWNSKGIIGIASYIGNLVIMNRITTSMCEKSYGGARFARVLTEVEAELGLVDVIKVFYKSLGKFMKLRVEYPWKPPLCSHCKVFGHGYDRCSNMVLSKVEKKQRDEMSGQRKERGVGNRNGGMSGRRSYRGDNVYGNFNGQRNGYGEGTSRGRVNGRGGGGFGGRGYGDQRLARSENTRYVIVKKNNNAGSNDGKESAQNKYGKNKVDTDIDNGGLSGHNDASSIKKGSHSSGNSNKQVNQ